MVNILTKLQQALKGHGNDTKTPCLARYKQHIRPMNKNNKTWSI